jgi:hypothetical protein
MSPYDQVAAVLAAATPGPWDVFEKRLGVAGSGSEPGTKRQNLADLRYKNGEADARFIAMARNTYPELLAVARAAEAVSEYEASHPDLVYVNLRAALDDLEAKIREVMP